MDIRRLLDRVESLELVIPEFQREFVWSLEQVKQLMVSLFRDYPTGSLLFWEAKGNDIPEIKNNAVAKDTIGLTKILLDGQQRLTSLYLLIKGDIPPYYTDSDINNDPRNLYFNLDDCEFRYYQKSKMRTNPLWQKVVNCFDGQQIDALEISEAYIEALQDSNADDNKILRQRINNNLNKLRAIEGIDYPIQMVPIKATIDDAIDVFDRINSLGTKLTDADLVLTHITGKWPEARRELKTKMRHLKGLGFDFGLDTLTRSIVVSLTGSALFNKNARLDYQQFTENDYKAAWDKVAKSMDYLIPILNKHALVDSSGDIGTNNILVPFIAVIMRYDQQLPEPLKFGFLYWMFLASIWSRYSGSTETKLDKDVHLALTSPEPVADLLREIEDQRGRIKVRPSDLEGRGAGHPIYKMLYVVTKHRDAIDWANGLPIWGAIGEHFSIQSHHIFPQSVLYKNSYDPTILPDKQVVNEISNRAFITRDANFAISDSHPCDYLPKIEENYPGALERQFIPLNKELWSLDNYVPFLEKRRLLIANGINDFLETLRKRWRSIGVTDEEINITTLIEQGESDFVEFKSSLRWDLHQQSINKKLEYVVARTIAAFLNSEGGHLLIGIEDDGKVIGLDLDYKAFGKKQNRDGFLLCLTDVINHYLGKHCHEYIRVSVRSLENQDISVIAINKSDVPVFLKGKDGEEFFIRATASTQALSVSEAHDYIDSHWDNK